MLIILGNPELLRKVRMKLEVVRVEGGAWKLGTLIWIRKPAETVPEPVRKRESRGLEKSILVWSRPKLAKMVELVKVVRVVPEGSSMVM